MGIESSTIDLRFLSQLARGGFAEQLTDEQRREIHIKTRLDGEGFLQEALEDGKQVVLTGNPGDGKTQYILQMKSKYPEPEYFYLSDASEYDDYTVLLDEWQEALEDGRPGILAINDGPLYDMTREYFDEYSFLNTVHDQFQNQIIYSRDQADEVEFDSIVVIDLNNRNILTRKVIGQAIENLASSKFLKKPDGSEIDGHIAYNIDKMRNNRVRDNIIRLLQSVGQLDAHVTVRDLLNFLAYCITGAKEESVVDFGEELKYYNLAFSGSGTIFSLLNEHFHPRDLTHPFIDSKLWADAEEETSKTTDKVIREEVDQLYIQKKRQFYFEDTTIEDYTARDLYHEVNYSFHNQRSRDRPDESVKEDIIEMINSYFMPDSSKGSDLKIWLSHNYRSKPSTTLISRTEIPKRELKRRVPQLHPAISNAMDYNHDHHVLEYEGRESDVRLRIDSELSETLGALEGNIPYILRDREEEQQLLEFMEEIEYRESHDQDYGTVHIMDVETGELEILTVNDDRYQVERR
ncbi:hypothetical protein K0C01_05260 [Salinarchaeum sp. IM2453]|uniref:hypothetical protein n=1 Tax=Salinarchaeum sp. IM2453 TaxID=2862870 RepID=UPI001C82AA25|nr:hypothetical protein [Salinarchaeum sp. IM2453]QZA89540.1 hypothetical protein K0C01_05260 [Salinarchaeum sp. IM2453]